MEERYHPFEHYYHLLQTCTFAPLRRFGNFIGVEQRRAFTTAGKVWVLQTEREVPARRCQSWRAMYRIEKYSACSQIHTAGS